MLGETNDMTTVTLLDTTSHRKLSSLEKHSTATRDNNFGRTHALSPHSTDVLTYVDIDNSTVYTHYPNPPRLTTINTQLHEDFSPMPLIFITYYL